MNKSRPVIFLIILLATFFIMPSGLNSQGLEPQVPDAALQKVFERSPEILAAISAHILDRQLLAKILWLENQGRYAEAIPLVEDIVGKSEKTLGAQHAFVAKATDYLAMLYSSAGDPKAYELNLKALDMLEKAKGPDHLDVATSLYNLAFLYKYMGDYIKAIELNIRALGIRKKSLGIEHPEVADSLNELGNLAALLNQIDMAYQHYYPAFLIRSKVLGPDHPITAASLNNLGYVYEKKQDYAKAEEFYHKALGIHEKNTGPNSEAGSAVLVNLGNIYYLAGNFKKAIQSYERALAIRKQLLGAEHWQVYGIYPHLLVGYAANGETRKAYEVGQEVIDKDIRFIEQVFGLTSEFQKVGFVQKKKYLLDLCIGLVCHHFNQDQEAKEFVLSAWLNRKGIIFDAHRRLQEPTVSHDNRAERLRQELQEIRVKLSDAVMGKFPPQEQALMELDAKKQNLERELSNICRSGASGTITNKVNVQQIVELLPEKSALIEIVDVQVPDHKGKELAWHYIAFVLSSQVKGHIEILDLGEHETINKQIEEMRKSLIDRDNKFIDDSRGLYKSLFGPLKASLEGVKTIYLSLDGHINVLPFEILLGEHDRYLIEDYTFNYLASGKDLTGFGRIDSQGKKYVLFGDPDFDQSLKENNPVNQRAAGNIIKARQSALRSPDLTQGAFRRLPGAAEEVRAVRAILGGRQTELYLGKRASEEALYEMETPKILHLATHGFYLADQALENTFLSGGARGITQTKDEFPGKINKRIKFYNPLLLSGFVLAGANSAWEKAGQKFSNGIVTAEKITGLHLKGTDLVVLSACGSGLGDIRHGEGIFGLRRAFGMAGAKSMVMSMWKVPDRETKELMVAFYTNLKAGLKRSEALRQAALDQKQVVQERYGQAQPFYWGGFIFSGEP